MLTFRPLYASKISEVADLQRVLEDAPAYSRLVNGRPPLPTDAEDVFADLPPGFSAKNKLVAGFFSTTGWWESLMFAKATRKFTSRISACCFSQRNSKDMVLDAKH